MPSKNNLPFAEYSKILTSHLEQKSLLLRKKTIQDYGSILKGFLKWKETHFKAPNDTYLLYLLEKGSSKRTAHNKITTLKTILKEVSKKTGLDLNDLAEYKKIRYGSTSPMYFTDEQLQKIKNAIFLDNPYFYLPAALLFSCFIRPNELRHLIRQSLFLFACGAIVFLFYPPE